MRCSVGAAMSLLSKSGVFWRCFAVPPSVNCHSLPRPFSGCDRRTAADPGGRVREAVEVGGATSLERSTVDPQALGAVASPARRARPAAARSTRDSVDRRGGGGPRERAARGSDTGQVVLAWEHVRDSGVAAASRRCVGRDKRAPPRHQRRAACPRGPVTRSTAARDAATAARGAGPRFRSDLDRDRRR